jgi:ATP-dependent protease ClpP protease subunit
MDPVYWMANKKRKLVKNVKADDDDEGIPFPFQFPKLELGGGASIYTHANHIYFNDDINDNSTFALNKELRSLETKLMHQSLTYGIDAKNTPIYLHLSTLGGSIHAAFSVVDCIRGMHVPVYTVADGFVASAGTIISISGTKRFIQPNGYMLLHQLSSSVWGKMAEIEDEYDNLKKLMDHVIDQYVGRTKLTRKILEKQLKKDITWNASECIKRGIVDEIYKP